MAVPIDSAENLKQWVVVVANQANVPGVAVVTDDTLDQANAPVYQIVASSTSTIAWTATNGTTTVSGTSTGTANAPAGFRFATSTVTSHALPGPNEIESGTDRSNFTVTYRYRVTSEAPRGEQRTNHASAVMTYPNFPQLADIPLTIPPHTIEFMSPFSRATVDKSATGSLVAGEFRQQIPLSGSAQHVWYVDSYNSANVPGVPRVTDTTLSDDQIRVTRITATSHVSWAAASSAVGGSVDFVLDDGTAGTAPLPYTAPAGRYITSATVTGVAIAGPNSTPARTEWTLYRLNFFYALDVNSTAGWLKENTATMTMSYPGYDTPAVVATDSARVRLLAPAVSYTATFPRAPQLPGGASVATTTTDVTFTVGGVTSGVAPTRDITPQYVFVAPTGWNITPGSAAFAAGSVPAGVSFEYRTVVLGGVTRQAVVATWPAGTVFGENTTLPEMSVVARPTTAVVAGAQSQPDAFIGESGQSLPGDIFTTPYIDAADLDGDGSTAERFSQANNANSRVTVGSAAAMQVLKEICLPDAAEADGCDWIADPNSQVGVPPNATSIRYRLTVTNTGNTTLSDIVAYDVLPYPGDTGTSDATGSTQRGSTFRELISGVSNVTGGATIAYSGAEQPCRPEVDATVPGCVNDWGSSSSNAQAIRMQRVGAFAPGASISMQYTASVLESPGDGAVGCNSVAVRATGLANVSEPAPVCAAIEETDLRIVAGAPQLQTGRPGVLPFTVTNLGGALSTTGSVDVAIPAGISVTNFTPVGWVCTATDADGNAAFGTAVGPATVVCTPNSALLRDTPVALNIPVVPTGPLSDRVVIAEISGQLFDGNLANNEDQMTFAAAASGELALDKDDGVTTLVPGQTTTYTFTVTNPLLFETLTGAVLSDVLPGGTEFVSASDGGTLSSGTVTWDLDDIAPAGTVAVTLTVRVLSTVGPQIDNSADVSVPDPANPSAVLTATDDDIDVVVTSPAVTLDKKLDGRHICGGR